MDSGSAVRKNRSRMRKSGWILICLTLPGVLCATGSTANAEIVGAPGSDPAAALFDPTSVAAIEFTLPQASREALELDPETYVPARLRITSSAGAYDSVEPKVGLRLKGTTSFRDLNGKAAFKVKFNEFGGSKFLELKKLTLNNMVQDPSMLRETLTYELFRAAGVPAPRTGYASVSVNGALYGVYLNVETMDDVALDLWFDSTQHLYEGSFDVDARAADIPLFEVDEGESSDRADLEALAAAVAATGASFSQRVAGLADLAEMTSEFAVEKYAGAWDNYTSSEDPQRPNNYYLHSSDAGLFSVIPWGHDQSLERDITFDGRGGVLFEGCRSDPACWSSYRGALAALPGKVAALGLDSRAAAIAAMLEPLQAAEIAATPSRAEFTKPEVTAAVAETREFLRLRPYALHDPGHWLLGPPLPVPPPGDPSASPRSEVARDLEPPETSISRAPRQTVRTGREHVAARFRFESSEPGSGFECRLDDGVWRSCGSPERVRVGLGRHLFRVRAVDAAGNVDPRAARHRWAVQGR